MQGLCEACRTARQPIDLLSLDVRRAYDSVSLTTLQASLRRICVPEEYIRMLSTIHTSRSSQILTIHGLTEPYTPATGLDQGEINAPILWLIVYDPLLCLLEQSGKGVNLGQLVPDTPAMRKIHPELRIPASSPSSTPSASPPTRPLDSTVVFGGAYADDLTLVAPSRMDLQALADTCNAWFDALDIEINPVKSIHLSYDPTRNRHTPGDPIQVGSAARRAPVLRLQGLKEPLRILGMYTVPDGDTKPIVEMCRDLVLRQAASLRGRALTDKIALFMVRAG